MKFIKKHSRALKTAAFLLATVLILGICNFVVRPVWTDWNNYNTTHGIYEEPKNTIETLFVGKSAVMNAIIPIQLYEEYGICAYDLSTEDQPMLASYYWVEEGYRLHSETLDTVVLDVSGLCVPAEESFYHKALDAMHFSSVKLDAVRAYSGNFEQTIQNLIPLLSYHARWSDLSDEDIQKAGYEPELSLRGYNYSTSSLLDEADNYDEISLPLYETDAGGEVNPLDLEALSYLEKMTEFCDEKDIRLILIKNPSEFIWDSAFSNAVQAVADSYGLEFLDLNLDPYYDETGFNFATDSIDNQHANYRGASKITSYIGKYLSEECGCRDVRDDNTYKFMEEELEEFNRISAGEELCEITDPCEYLSYLNENGDYTVFLSVKTEAAKNLTNAQREYFASVDLNDLANLSTKASYLSVIENDQVLKELSEADPQNEEGSPVNYSGTLKDGTTYSVISGGKNLGNTSSILIDGEEYSPDSRGLNIVVYDNLRGEVIDAAVFDTHVAPEREDQDASRRLQSELVNGASFADLEGKDRLLFQYDRACENKKVLLNLQKETASDGFVPYLETFYGISDMDIYLTVKNDASGCLTDKERETLSDLGLEELSEISYQDSYLALIEDGKVVFEQRNQGKTPLEASFDKAELSSGGYTSGDVSSVLIDGKEYSPAGDGINVVVYDTCLQTVIDTAVFSPGAETPGEK